MLRRFTSLLVAATAATVLGQTGAQTPGPQTYATRVQPIRAGIVVVTDNAGNQQWNAAPHAWYNLDSNRSVKPIGWNVYNPHAPGRVTAAIQSRWTAANVGERLSKRYAPYWEVSLTTASDDQLADYDVLLVSPAGQLSLRPNEREKLRKFVDHGGILWVDGSALNPGTSGVDQANSLPIPFLPIVPTAGSGVQYSDFTHPLLSKPYSLTARDVNLLNTGFDNSVTRFTINPLQFASLDSLYLGAIADYYKLRPVTLVDTGTTTGIAQIGDGYVVVTSRGVASKLNRVSDSGLAYNNNQDYIAKDPYLEIDGTTSAKFVVNMISLLTENRQFAGGTHRSGGSAIDSGAPMLGHTVDRTTGFSVSPDRPDVYGRQNAVFYKGLLIVPELVNGKGRLVAYDPNPGNDLDGDGNPDDGQYDRPGSGYDRVWESPDMQWPISPPATAEVPEAPYSDMVLVVDGSGNLHAFNPIARNANGSFDGNVRQELFGGSPIAPPSPSVAPADNAVPLPPTIFEGMAYVADAVNSGVGDIRGRVWVVNLKTGAIMKSPSSSLDWFIGGTTSPVAVPEYTAAPTIGYIPILDNSGGVDKVLYAPFTQTGVAPTGTSAGFVSLWIGSRGEKPTFFEVTGGVLQVQTRAYQQGGLPIYTPATPSDGRGDPQGVRLTILVNGRALTESEMANYFTGSVSDSGGLLMFPLKGAATLPAGFDVRVDYTIDWGGNPANLQGVERGRLQLPDSGGNAGLWRIVGPLALTPKGSVYLTARSGALSTNPYSFARASSLFGFKEEGRGSFRCINRFDMTGSYQFTPNGGGPVTQPGTLEDNDTIARRFAPAFLDQPMLNYSVMGPPAVRGDVVYVAAGALKGSFVASTVVMAFQAEPEVPQFRVNSDLPDGSYLVQPDMMRSSLSTSSGVATADSATVLPPANYVYEADTKTVRLENLMNVQRGQIQQCINLSQPIYVRAPGQADQLLIPDAQGGDSRWSPLLWYTVINGYAPRTGPVVTGDTLYLAGQSSIRSILSGGPPTDFDALLFAMRSQIGNNDAFLKATPGRTWLKQLWMLDDSKNYAANSDFKWPQLVGSASFDDYKIRLNQTTLPGSSDIASIAVGNGTLAALGSAGLYTFDRADLIVADEGRIGVYDPSGNPIWTSSSFASTGVGDTGTAAIVRKLVRPTRAYRVGASDLLVVDSGGNRVVRMNMAGYETRSISELRLDKNHVPVGFPSNGPLILSDPRDATTYTSIEQYSAQADYVTQGDGEAANAYEYWVHTLVADAGNRRLIEVIDRFAYDPVNGRVGDTIKVDGTPQLSVILWHSPAGVSGKGYAYNSISRVIVPTSATTSKNVFVASVGGTLPTRESAGLATPTAGSESTSAGGNGGIVVFDPANPSGPIVFNKIQVPATGAGVFFNESTGKFDSTARASRIQTLTNVSSVTTYLDSDTANNTLIRFMITDASGIYEAYYDATAAATTTPTNPTLSVSWMMPNEIYRVLRHTGDTVSDTNPKNLRATYARRLNADNVLIVNGYFGTRLNGTAFQGEVLQLNGIFDLNTANLGFSSASIVFELPPIQGTRGIVLPAFADRR